MMKIQTYLLNLYPVILWDEIIKRLYDKYDGIRVTDEIKYLDAFQEEQNITTTVNNHIDEKGMNELRIIEFLRESNVNYC